MTKANRLTMLVSGAFFLVPALWAQNPTSGNNQPNTTTPPANTDVQKDKTDIQKDKAGIAKDVQDVKNDQQKLVDLNKAHADALSDLAQKEAAEIKAVNQDKSLTPAQRRAKLKEIRESFKGQRKDLNTKYASDKKALRGDIHNDRKDIRQDRRDIHKDRQDIRQDRRDIRQDMRGNHGR